MRNLLLIFSAGFLFGLSNCQKNDGSGLPADPAFRLDFHNEFNQVERQYAVFISDKNGQLRAFRWLPGNDTARVTVPDAQTGDRYDCTLAEINILVAPGSGVRDTTVTLTTYTNLFNGASFHLRDLGFLQNTDLSIQFTGLNTLDSIVVPDGLSFSHPQPANDFQGVYRVLHTGRIWCRVKVNGEPDWRYVYLENINSPTHNVVVDAGTLPQISGPALSVGLPLLTNWDYQLDGIINAEQRHFLALGPALPIPGSAVPIFDQINTFEPFNTLFSGYRLRATGFDSAPGSYGYACDLFFNDLPDFLPAPVFDIQLATPTDNRQASFTCNGFMQLLALKRYLVNMPKLSWEVLLAPPNTGQMSYRLPEVPQELAELFPGLENYDFGDQLEIRAESYLALNAYPEVIARRMQQDDPLWQMKAGYVARKRVFQ